MGAAATTPSAVPSKTITSINPATGEPIGEVPDMAPDEVRAVVEKARAAQREWAKVPLETRCRRVAKFADVLMANAEEVIDILVREAGKTRVEALGMELIVVADIVRYFTKHAPEMLAPEPISLHLM